MSRGVVWFRNDLRLTDNPAWGEATSEHDSVTALFVMDPVLWERSPQGRRTRLAAHLTALDLHLSTRGGRLRVERGDPRQVVPKVAGGDAVHWNSDVTPYAAARDRVVAELVDESVTHGRWIVPIGSVRTNEGGPYRVFTPFHRKWRDEPRHPWAEGREVQVADHPGYGLKAEDPSDAGERAARERLTSFLDIVDDYEDFRDRPDIEGTSRLSEDLKFGTISPRLVEREAGDSTEGRAAFARQLAWREFCAQLLHAYPRLPMEELRPEYAAIAWRDDPGAVEAWKAGQTGFPFVDAGMRQLAAEGWMHNRLRMVTASFLVKDLLVDWRVGERHFADLLHDYDVAQNAVNWQWVAGTGADAAPYFRVFNPVSQGLEYDPGGDYVRRWIPELADISGATIHTPWDAGPIELQAAGITLGATYPERIVDHAEARERAIEVYEVARQH